MAGRSAAPKPRKGEPANRSRNQKKITYEPITTASSKRTEKDVIKAINCLAEWTRNLQGVRAPAPTVPSRSGSRPRSRVRRGVSSASGAPRYPRGNPLTESMEFTDRDGAAWLAYIEGGGPAPSAQPTSITVLPERHLRFDSASESRFTSLVPAGSPFLGEARLQSLLDNAQLDLPLEPISDSSVPAPSGFGNGVIEQSTRAIESTRVAVADWSLRLRQAADRGEPLRRHLVEVLTGAVHTMHGLAQLLLGHRPARP